METFAERLRGLRTARSLSTSDLAYRIGVTEGAIRQMESGRTKSAGFTIGLKLAEVLEVDPWFLATGVAQSKESHDPHAGTVKDRLARLEARMERVEREVTARQLRRGAAR